MKYLVLNFSGNVGKSTLAMAMLMPRLPGAEYFSVESTNAGADSEAENIRGKQFGALQEHLMLLDSAVVDVGASNIEDFMKLMNEYRGSHEDFDKFIIPAVKENKQMADTIGTIAALKAMGVPAKKIFVVFNMVETDDAVETAFYPLFAYNEDNKAFTLKPQAAVNASVIYQQIRQKKTTIEKLLADDTDYKQALRDARNAGNTAEAERCASMISMKRLAVGASENLDRVFALISK